MSKRERFQGPQVPVEKVYGELGDTSTWEEDKKAYEKKLNAPYLTDPDQKLVGTYRRFGDAGPTYQVLSVSDGYADVEFPESEEKIKMPVAAVRLDPVDE